jgi:2-polyprenyl-3-methyl-5-hydroxy-6-metoxy-1,4-benzoquinol methylase
MDEVEIRQLDALESTHFWYKARKMQLSIWFRSLNAKEFRVLDLGSATGGNTLHIASMGHFVTSAEYSDIGIQIQKSKGIEVVWADARKLPFEDESFDVVICLDVLEHIEEDFMVISEISRVLKSGGRFLISVPEDPRLWSSHDVSVNHIRRYTRNSLLDLVNITNLRVTTLWNTLFLLRPGIVFTRKFDKGSSLKTINPVLNLILYLICLLEFKIPKFSRKGVTLWLDGQK